MRREVDKEEKRNPIKWSYRKQQRGKMKKTLKIHFNKVLKLVGRRGILKIALLRKKWFLDRNLNFEFLNLMFEIDGYY